MPATRQPNTIPPSIPSYKAVELLTKKIDDIDRIRTLRNDDPEFRKWKDTTEAIPHAAFGKPNGVPHQMTQDFDSAGYYPARRVGFSGRGGTPDHVIQQRHQQSLLQKKAALESCIEQLQLLQPPPTTASIVAETGRVGLHPQIRLKCEALYASGAFAEAVEKSFKVVRDRLRNLTGYEKGSEAFGKGKLHIKGAAAPHVDPDFNDGAKFLMMAIDMFRNEKSHTADAKITDPVRAEQYLMLSSLAMYFLDDAEIH
jgi:uncharacterized protein (TIGR02391 family)